MSSKDKSFSSFQPIGHALDILEEFNSSPDGLGITELSRRLNLHKNKVFRLLATLESRGYVDKIMTNSTYRLGVKNLFLGLTFSRQMRLLQHSRPVQEALVRECNETSHIAILKDFHVINIDRVESELPVRVITQVGEKLPIYCTAAGKVLASSINEEYLKKYFNNRELKKYTDKTISGPDALLIQLRRSAEKGYAIEDEELIDGVRSVGAPICDYTRKIIGAVSVTGPMTRISDRRITQELIPLVTNAARNISRRLGN